MAGVPPQRTAYSRELSACITDALTLAQAGNDVGSSDADGAVMVERAERTLACGGVYGLPFIDIEGPGIVTAATLVQTARLTRYSGLLQLLVRRHALTKTHLATLKVFRLWITTNPPDRSAPDRICERTASRNGSVHPLLSITP